MEKMYVKVSADFDQTGYMRPTAIKWKDGRVFKIDEMCEFRPAADLGFDFEGDCYIVRIGDQKRHLFFERAKIGNASVGRWFVSVRE